MKKSLDDRKVNRNVKKLNRELKNDVFGTRFEARQLKKSYKDGIRYYLYELRDNLQPERNKIVGWENAFALYTFNKIWTEMNDFIVTSDFWSTYNK